LGISVIYLDTIGLRRLLPVFMRRYKLHLCCLINEIVVEIDVIEAYEEK
jgi:hypothetical protein